MGEPPTGLSDVHAILADAASYPLGITFARPLKSDARWTSPSRGRGAESFRDSEAETVCVAVDSLDKLGCVFSETDDNEIIVTDMPAVPGEFQNAISKFSKMHGQKISLSVDSLNGQFVPSYATADMVRNAIMRSWKTDGRVEMWLCDNSLKQWVHESVKE